MASGAVVEAEVALEAKVVARETEVDWWQMPERLWGGKEGSQAAEEEAETTSHKEGRPSWNNFCPCLPLFHLKERTLGCLLCHLVNDRAF